MNMPSGLNRPGTTATVPRKTAAKAGRKYSRAEVALKPPRPAALMTPATPHSSAGGQLGADPDVGHRDAGQSGDLAVGADEEDVPAQRRERS